MLVVCFINKHQTIGSILKTHVASRYSKLLAWVYFVTIFPMPAIALNIIHVPKEKQYQYIQTHAPEYIYNFFELPNLDIWEHNYKYVIITVIALTTMFVGTIFVTFLVVDILRLMQRLRLQISVQTYQKHKEAMRSLMVQSITVVFCILPIFIFLIFNLLELPHSQFISELCIVWFSGHSSINMVSLMMFFRPYRQFISKRIKM
ncbi:hypothetical protein CRE_05096 [Caenorhabditis remanei]|uniref:G-protein coupled receptors family 1 profile domain-containing protein n=1 Tax=Caenorhabditis remanei TaxID=31234 RepID=E3MZ59_CAERE|nr:hypothetical protein CRE_05096 [Caenorhabditis remanei]